MSRDARQGQEGKQGGWRLALTVPVHAAYMRVDLRANKYWLKHAKNV